ncbi:hypothetical protein EDD21DRAFT_369410 [Dissophora ornata]|nr:hypothetical protein EDD21DRAFT_369410 [Dissophora ornata]
MSSPTTPGSRRGRPSRDLVSLALQQSIAPNEAFIAPSNGQDPDPVDSLGLDLLSISMGQPSKKSSGAQMIRKILKKPYRCAGNTKKGAQCKTHSSMDLYLLPDTVPFYCNLHSPDEDSSRLRCIAIKTEDQEQCSYGYYKVLYTGKDSEETYICNTHKGYNVLQGHIFRVGKSAVELQRYFITSRAATDGVGPAMKPGAPPIEVPSSPELSSSAMSSPMQRINIKEYLTDDILVKVKGDNLLFMSGRTFDDLTVELGPLVKERVRQLIVDFFLLLSTDDNGSKISVGAGHSSYFGKSLKGKGKSDSNAYLNEGYVYVLLFLPSNDGRQRMIEASKQVAGKSVALKIGYSKSPVDRIAHHRESCTISEERSRIFPTQGPLPFAHLFEKIVHEILVAHQHDIWCSCKTTHTEMFWFDRVPGDTNGTESYDAALALLEPILNKWMDSIRQLGQDYYLIRAIQGPAGPMLLKPDSPRY